ncbi:MAG: nucleoside triphosphate pyrophosphohydrolase [Pseudomonadota bacterium]
MTLKNNENDHTIAAAIKELASIMADLRHPETGCPWDIKQTSKSIAPYTIEEAYEVVDAIESGTPEDVCNELGDLLLQVVFHAQMASENGEFTLYDVIKTISNKMIRRHPHVFSQQKGIDNAQDQTRSWEDMKAIERGAKTNGAVSALDGIAKALPAVTRAEKLQKRAARVGFDWPDESGARLKLSEELEELSEAAASQDDAATLDEAGDVLFSCVNYLRKLGVSADDAMRQANQKFEKRFRVMESSLSAQAMSMETAGLEEMEAAWQQAKAEEET